jgi:hypothetical protein
MVLDGVRMLAVILAIGSGMWIGGLVTVVILSRASAKTVAAGDRVALFRSFGKGFAVFVGVTALFVVLPALALAVIEPVPLTAGILVLAFGLLLVTAVGILQARRMSVLRGAAASGGGDPVGLRRNAAAAVVLRSLIGVLGLTLLVLAALFAAHA